jgi:hypothetical protein
MSQIRYRPFVARRGPIGFDRGRLGPYPIRRWIKVAWDRRPARVTGPGRAQRADPTTQRIDATRWRGGAQRPDGELGRACKIVSPHSFHRPIKFFDRLSAVTREMVTRICECAERPERHGKWAEFARANGLTVWAVFWWRKKLGYRIRSYQPDSSATAADS